MYLCTCKNKIIMEKEERIQVTLPPYIDYDLEGFRGFGMTRFPLVFEEKCGKIVGSYCNDKAGYALYTEWGETKWEVINKLYDKINK